MKKILSIIIIVKNGQEMIQDCLDSVSFASEIILVNNKSTDNTAAIAGKNKNVFVVNDATEDFSKLRNKGLEMAQGEWVFYIDVDERVSNQLQKQIERVINIPVEKGVFYSVMRKNFYLGNNEWPGYELIPRLFLKKYLKGWKGTLHESPIVDGKRAILEGFLLHYSHSDLTTMLAKTIEWSKIEAQLRYDTHHPPMVVWRFFRVMTTAFLSSYILQKGWKVGVPGFIESMYQSFSMFITYARLWEIQKGFDTERKNV